MSDILKTSGGMEMVKKGYLICDKCKGYYLLKEGESLEDFEGCECGGNIRFAEINKLHGKSFDELNFNANLENKICKNCGANNLFNSSFCIHRGEDLDKIETIPKNSPEILKEIENTEMGGKLQNKIRSWGIALIFIGIIQIISFGMLDQYWGVLLIIVGLISFVIVQRIMFIIFGTIVLVAAISNLITGGGWALFSIIQFIIAIKQFYEFIKWPKPSSRSI